MIKIIDLPTILMFMGFTHDQFDVYDDGEGPYIKEWTASVPEPTREQIESAYKQLKVGQEYKVPKVRKKKSYKINTIPT
ncbi:MAG: XkdW family protein [Nitrosopumilaceae archaeon]